LPLENLMQNAMPLPLRSLSGYLDFDSAARHGSFRLAAEELHKTPAAISQQIKQLEYALGFTLFTRHPRHVALTDKGEQLAQAIGTLLGQLRTRIEALQAQDDDATLNVSIGHSLAMKWLVPQLHDFNRRHPEIDVRIHASDALVSLEDGIHDIALRSGYLTGHPEEEIVYREKLVVLCSPSLDPTGIWRETPPHLETLLNFPLLYNASVTRTWLTLIAREGLQHVTPKFTRSYSHFGLMVQAAAAGLGVTLAPTALAQDDLVRGQLIMADCPPIATGEGYRLLFARNRGDIAKIALFRQWIADKMKDL